MAATSSYQNATSVGIIGGGSAGIFTACELQKQAEAAGLHFDITVLEKDADYGGNARGRYFDVDGQKVWIDCGAEFFSKGSEPDYYQMLQDEGLFGGVRTNPAGMSVSGSLDGAARKKIFWCPDNLGEITVQAFKHIGEWLNFGDLCIHAHELFHEHGSKSWETTLGEFLDEINFLGENGGAWFRQQVARPLLYQFGLVDPSQLDALSAKWTIYYFVGMFPTNPLTDHPFEINTLETGMYGVLEALLAKRGLTQSVHTDAEVVSVSGGPPYTVALENGSSYQFDRIVYATNPLRSMPLLPATSPSRPYLEKLLGQMPYKTIPVEIHRSDTQGPSPYVPPPGSDAHWEISNPSFTMNGGQTDYYAQTVWFGNLERNGLGKPFFKSWGSPQLEPPQATAHMQTHDCMWGTTGFIAAREELRNFLVSEPRGYDFVGGYLWDYDTQNTCLKSARNCAQRIIAAGQSEQHALKQLDRARSIETDSTHEVPLPGWIEKLEPQLRDRSDKTDC